MKHCFLGRLSIELTVACSVDIQGRAGVSGALGGSARASVPAGRWTALRQRATARVQHGLAGAGASYLLLTRTWLRPWGNRKDRLAGCSTQQRRIHTIADVESQHTALACSSVKWLNRVQFTPQAIQRATRGAFFSKVVQSSPDPIPDIEAQQTPAPDTCQANSQKQLELEHRGNQM